MRRVWRFLGRLLGIRIVQFLLLGALLFALLPAGSQSYRISLSRERLDALKAAQARRQGQARLDAQGAREVEVQAAEDEVLYREALRLGLDRSDDVVRRRLVQKMLFLAEDLGGASRPASDAELRRFFESHADRYRDQPRRHFVHVYARTEEGARALRTQAAALPVTSSPPPLGEAFPLARQATLSRSGVAAQYGEPFASAVFAAKVGDGWSDVVASKFGFHLVSVVEEIPGGPASYESVAGRVRLDELDDRRQRAVNSFVSRAASRYRVDLDGAPWTPDGSSKRVAFGVRSEEGQGD